ncbi:MAG: bifunctional phosphoglucose/phosphomannose isomerase, partial [Bacteroidetes bacterium]
MDKMIARFPQQLEEALEIAATVSVQRHQATLRSVLIAGMGGSGIGGNFVQDLVSAECKTPILVNKGYIIPKWVNKHTLAICSSYSGNTEETLHAMDQLLQTGAKVICVSSGGKLLERAREHGLDFVQLPGGWSSPRACLGYSIVAQLAVLRQAKLISSRIFRQIAAAQKMLIRDQAEIQRRAQKIAGFIADKTPVLYCSDHMEAVALRWRQQFNENAKMLCWHHVVPEMNHNELVGWRDSRNDLAVIWMRNRDDFSRNTIRMDINKEIIEHFTNSSI